MGSHESAASGALLYFFLVMPYDGQQLGICYGSVNDGQWGAYSVFLYHMNSVLIQWTTVNTRTKQVY